MFLHGELSLLLIVNVICSQDGLERIFYSEYLSSKSNMISWFVMIQIVITLEMYRVERIEGLQFGFRGFSKGVTGIPVGLTFSK